MSYPFDKEQISLNKDIKITKTSVIGSVLKKDIQKIKDKIVDRGMYSCEITIKYKGRW